MDTNKCKGGVMFIETLIELNEKLTLIVGVKDDLISFRTLLANKVSEALVYNFADLIAVCKSDFEIYKKLGSIPKTAKGFPYAMCVMKDDNEDAILIGKVVIGAFDRETLDIKGITMTSFLLLALAEKSGSLEGEILKNMKVKGEA